MAMRANSLFSGMPQLKRFSIVGSLVDLPLLRHADSQMRLIVPSWGANGLLVLVPNNAVLRSVGSRCLGVLAGASSWESVPVPTACRLHGLSPHVDLPLFRHATARATEAVDRTEVPAAFRLAERLAAC